jgi:hypothetical protein
MAWPRRLLRGGLFLLLAAIACMAFVPRSTSPGLLPLPARPARQQRSSSTRDALPPGLAGLIAELPADMASGGAGEVTQEQLLVSGAHRVDRRLPIHMLASSEHNAP